MLLVDRQIFHFEQSWAESFVPKRISVVIPVYAAKAEGLDLVISLILSQKDDFDIELIVVNNGISEEFLEKNFYRTSNETIKIIKNNLNMGASYARNQGASHASGEFLLFVDSDIIGLTDDCLAFMVKTLLTDNDYGVIGAQAISYDSKDIELSLGRYSDPLFNRHREKYTKFEVEFNNTSCIMVRRRDFQLVNGFTDYIEYAHDDVDFGFKIRQLGLKCIVDYRAVCFHPAYSIKAKKQMQWMMYKNAIVFYFVNYKYSEILKFILHKIKLIILSLRNFHKPNYTHASTAFIADFKNEDPYINWPILVKVVLFLLPRIFIIAALRKERKEFLGRLPKIT